MPPQSVTDRVAERLDALWWIALGPGGGADRPAFSRAEAEAILMVAEWARAAGLEPGVDPHGNLWAPPAGWDGPLITAGSHVDTVPDGGRYDGALGTVLGLELAHDLREGTDAGARPALLVCTAEEAPRFRAGTIGSRLLVGSLSPPALAEMEDAAGIDAAGAQADYLDALDELPTIEPPLDRVRAHAEVHIATRSSIRELGVIQHVAAPLRLEIELNGEAGHAGEISMDERHDALAAAAEVILAVERAARAEPRETVATVGTLALEPGALSVIPSRVRLGVDVRAIDGGSLDRVDEAIRTATDEVAARRAIKTGVRVLRSDRPTELDPGLADSALEAADRLGVPATRTWSGSGHDAQHLAAVTRALLIFVPLRSGESHTPLEDADPNDIENALRIVREVLKTAR